MYVAFNFLTEELTNKNRFLYQAVQKYSTSGDTIGGETCEVRKLENITWEVDAVEDETIPKNDSVELSATEIIDNAIYNWYDTKCNLIFSGTSLMVVPDITKTYKLEIISDDNGFKDYDYINVTVDPYYILSLTPNPTSSLVTNNYLADESTSAYIYIANTVTGTDKNNILDAKEKENTIDVSNYSIGLYSVSLICDGVLEDSELLVIQ